MEEATVVEGGGGRRVRVGVRVRVGGEGRPGGGVRQVVVWRVGGRGETVGAPSAGLLQRHKQQPVKPSDLDWY